MGLVSHLAPKLLKCFMEIISLRMSRLFWSIKLLLIITSLGFLSYTYDYNGLFNNSLFLTIIWFYICYKFFYSFYLILALAKNNDVTLDVGFYYMANAIGRLLGCIISGFSYQIAGLIGCFIFAGIFLFFCSIFSFYLKSY